MGELGCLGGGEKHFVVVVVFVGLGGLRLMVLREYEVKEKRKGVELEEDGKARKLW